MKVLVATRETQGQRANDFCWAEEGELVTFSVLECDREGVDGSCGCKRSLSGVRSGKGTTTLLVVDQAVTYQEVHAAITESVRAGGWVTVCAEETIHEYISSVLRVLLATAARHPVGTVLERREDGLQARSRVAVER